MLESDKYDRPHKSSLSEIPMRKVIDPRNYSAHSAMADQIRPHASS
ncbi:MAG: hypothetical protein KZQ66_11780 [Candidatus Thiodiazotropha sp. (ex Lucinoma aequizonata)]|nr:hypothetical protein [Candidatus Thiodiazotropha sp. (ex Lucinoma aequizonata)]MCU7887849.1 hypothetical protein [Candidatus Thiodiazotropha sp. (ex Lucinoma aequizonata)]MCU7895361.1 hypothetical protein [Candidatus Thiodiazotropha sp. (ex Lucinoma aequizonata)]MCU7899866.1 hypothetical protein [Candidatus Thiodiazotropha sp. (ex Lucinoma aequizonata)]MCU7902583.1 hypothetical protein [Candidatus Thiodiazotropha sp. (ex Lucinoma aequizonata)]